MDGFDSSVSSCTDMRPCYPSHDEGREACPSERLNLRLAKVMMKFKLNCGLIVALCLASIASADTLKLKNGSLIHGRFLGGTETEISFQVGSSVQKYNISDVVSLEFDSEGIAGDKPVSPVSDKPVAPESSLPDAPEAARPDSQTPGKVTIPAGTSISVRTMDVIDSTEK